MQYVEKKMFATTRVNKYVLPVVYDRRVKKTVVGGIELVQLKGMFVPRIEKLEREVLFQQEKQMFTFPYMTTMTKNMEMFELEQLLKEHEICLPLVKREYTQYYVEECQRLAHYIVKKLVQLEQEEITMTTVRPVPQTVMHLIAKIEKLQYVQHKLFKHEPVLKAIVQGGEFLALLKTIVEEIQLVKCTETVFRRVKFLFGENNVRFFQCLEKDLVLNMCNVKPHFAQLFKTIVEQEICMPWTTTVVEQPRWTTVVEPRMPWTTVEEKIKMMEIVEPKCRLFRSPSEFVLPKYL